MEIMAENRLWQKLQFRSWHRGTREMDLLMGSFADRYLPNFDARQLAQYAAILELSDPDLYNWITQKEPVPTELHSDVMDLLLQHKFPA